MSMIGSDILTWKVQWLWKLKVWLGEFPSGLVVRLVAFTALAQVQSLVGELRSYTKSLSHV